MKPARGTYRYWRDGQVMDVVEPWEVTATAAGLALRGRRIVAGTPVLAVAATYRGGGCERFEAAWQPAGAAARSVHYRRRGAQLEWHDGTAAPRRIEAPADSLLFPLLRAAAGALLPELARGPRCVVLPDLHDPAAPGFLHPLQSQRHAAAGTDGPRHYRYFGGEYGEAGADYWLDADGFVARYLWESPQGRWEIRRED